MPIYQHMSTAAFTSQQHRGGAGKRPSGLQGLQCLLFGLDRKCLPISGLEFLVEKKDVTQQFCPHSRIHRWEQRQPQK